MKLTVDSKVCAKHQLSVNEFLLLHLILQNHDCNGTVKDFVQRGLLQRQNGKVIVPESTKLLIQQVMNESGNVSEDRLNSLAGRMQKCFPEGKPQGSVTYYRANRREIIFSLQSFFGKYGSFSDDDIVDATQRYVDSFHGNYRYLPVITNYIIKSEKTLDEMGNPVIRETSQLATQLENVNDEPASIPVNDDSWLFTARN